MKKSLNIAYLNGAEGMIRKGASSGGSGSDSDNGDQFSYYRVNFNDDSYKSSKIKPDVGFTLFKGIPNDTDSVYDGDMCIALPDFIGDWESVVAVCAPALPIKFKDKIIDCGDWKRNCAETVNAIWPQISVEEVLNDYKFLEPITKEEFYNLE